MSLKEAKKGLFMCMYLMQIWNVINGEIIKGNFERRQKKNGDSFWWCASQNVWGV